MLKKILVLFLLAMVFILPSCATIMKGSSQKISIDSNVKGASIIINGKVVGTTPTVVNLDNQSDDCKVTLKKDGYEKKVVIIKSSTDSWFWGNILLGGFIGSSTDSSTGAMYSYSPKKYYVEMPSKTANYQIKAKMRYFVLMNYDRINKDIAQGHGEYIKTVCAFYGAKKSSDVKKMLPFLRRAQKETKTIVSFSDYLVSKI